MDREWSTVESALASGDTDRVNEVIDDVRAFDIDERQRRFEDWVDDLTALYADSDDGYVRQATVRVAEALAPGIAPAVNLLDDDRSTAGELESIREQTDATCEFLLRALTDPDGRVRNAAKRAFKHTVRTYEVLGDTETVEALIADLESRAEEFEDGRRDHLLDARDDAAFATQTGLSRAFEGLAAEMRESDDPDS